MIQIMVNGGTHSVLQGSVPQYTASCSVCSRLFASFETVTFCDLPAQANVFSYSQTKQQLCINMVNMRYNHARTPIRKTINVKMAD